MGRGIGKTQRRILDELAAADADGLTVVELAECVGASDRQIRRAVHALADRELVVLTKEHGGWKGEGRYGRLVSRREDWDLDVPAALTVKAGEPLPFGKGYPALRDSEFILNGMPTGPVAYRVAA